MFLLSLTLAFYSFLRKPSIQSYCPVEQGISLLPVNLDNRQWAHTEIRKKYPIQLKKKLLTVRVVKHCNRLPGKLRNLHLGNNQNLTGQDPEQLSLVDPALSSAVGLCDLQRSLPTSTFL